MALASQRHNRGGRPTKYTPATVEKICEGIARGLPYKFATVLAGVSQDTFFEWQKRYSEFADAIKLAVAKGTEARLKVIEKAANQGDVRAATWWLEHVLPEHFARTRLEHIHESTGYVRHEVVVTPELLATISESRKRYELGQNGS